MTYRWNDFHRLLGLEPDDLEPENTERVLEAAIGLLNLYGAELPQLSGTYGTKSIGVTQKQWSAVAVVARWFWVDFQEDGAGSFALQGLETKSRDYLADPDIIAQLIDLASRCQDEDGFDNILLI